MKHLYLLFSFTILFIIKGFSNDTIPSSQQEHIHGSSCNHGSHSVSNGTDKFSSLHKAKQLDTNPKVFPIDTMQHFIDKFGKDSLLKVLDSRIESTLDYITRDWVSLKISKETIPIVLMSRYYNLGLDTLPFDDRFYFGGFMILYGKVYGDTSEAMMGFREVKRLAQEKKMSIMDYCIKVAKIDYNTRDVVVPTAQLCHIISSSDGFCGEVVNNYFKENSQHFTFEVNLDLLLNVAMVLRDDDYTNKPHVFSELKGHLETYYNSYNMTSLISSQDLFEKADDDYFTYSSVIAATINNYVSYARIFDLSNQGRDLFHILSLYNQNDGGFLSYRNKSTIKSDKFFSMNVLWLLSQWREHLQTN
jgi:hypothetical protein